jgi:hypothetical protein
MKSFIIACVVAVVVAFGSAFILNQYQETAQTAFSSSTGVRV